MEARKLTIVGGASRYWNVWKPPPSPPVMSISIVAVYTIKHRAEDIPALRSGHASDPPSGTARYCSAECTTFDRPIKAGLIGAPRTGSAWSGS